MSISFAEKGGRLLSRPGRGARNAPAQRERERVEKAFRPDARAWFLPLRWRLLTSGPVIAAAVMGTHTIDGREYVVKPAVYGKPTFRNVIEDGEHR